MRAFTLPHVALLLLATACSPQPPAPPATPPVGIDLGAAAGQRTAAPAAANPHAHHAPATRLLRINLVVASHPLTLARALVRRTTEPTRSCSTAAS